LFLFLRTRVKDRIGNDVINNQKCSLPYHRSPRVRKLCIVTSAAGEELRTADAAIRQNTVATTMLPSSSLVLESSLVLTVLLLCRLAPYYCAASDHSAIECIEDDAVSVLSIESPNEPGRACVGGIRRVEDSETAEAAAENNTTSSSFVDHNHHPRQRKFVVRQVLRLPDITASEFKAKHSRPDVAVPVVFEADVMKDVGLWTRADLISECGDNELVRSEEDDDDADCDDFPSAYSDDDCHRVRVVNTTLLGKAWGSLAVADLGEFNITTMRDLLIAQDTTPEGSQLYLHDCAVHHCCPSMSDRLRVPKYFPRDYRDLKSDPKLVGKMKARHFPSIFVSKADTGSPLHSDADMSRFWVHMLSGKKLWRIFPPSEYWRLYPSTEDDDYYPQIFAVDAMEPDFEKFPHLEGALVYETVLSAGEVLFVPEGWPHQVYNLEDSVSTTMNFVDWDGMDTYLKHKAHREGKARFDGSYFHRMMTSFLMPLDDKERPGPEDNIQFDDYFNSHHFRTMEVPASVKDWVDIRAKYPEGINSYRTHDGFPALHVAAMSNFLSVVQYLLDNEADPNVRDYRGRTALDVSMKLEFNDVVECLKGYANDTSSLAAIKAGENNIFSKD